MITDDIVAFIRQAIARVDSAADYTDAWARRSFAAGMIQLASVQHVVSFTQSQELEAELEESLARARSKEADRVADVYKMLAYVGHQV